MAQTVLKELGAAEFDGMGPKVTGVSRSGLVATVTIQHNGGTALVARTVGQPITGWYANTLADFTGTDIAVTVAVSSANSVAVTFPSGAVFPVYLKHMGGRLDTMQSQNPDITNPVVDNFIYPVGAHVDDQLTNGVPVQPTPNPITVT